MVNSTVNDRILKLEKEIKRKKLSGILITKPENIKYLTGANCKGVLIISDTLTLLVIEEKDLNLARSSVNLESKVMVKSFEDVKNQIGELFTFDDEVGIESDAVTLKQLDNFKILFKTNFVETEDLVKKIREIKSDEEIDKIKILGKKLNKVLEVVKTKINVGQTEKQIKKDIEYELKKEQILDNAKIKVAIGKNTSDPYHESGNLNLERTNILIIEIKAVYDGYNAEIGRTFFVGEPEKEIKDKFNKLKEVQKKILRLTTKYGTISEMVENITEDLESLNWSPKYYIARGIGLEENEYPEIVLDNNRAFEENMVLIIEPQIYFPNEYGLIIKDTVVVTKASNDVVTEENLNIK